MSERKPLGKRTRFEVFKRDGFCCIYCGNTPPNVLLQVDHIVAVANGGPDDMENLVTSCQACNAGKSDVPLNHLPNTARPTSEQRQDKLEQLRAITEMALERREQEDEIFQAISDHWISLNGSDPSKYVVNDRIELNIRRFMEKLPPHEIMDAVTLALRKGVYDPNRFFCAVCWKKIKTPGDYPPAPHPRKHFPDRTTPAAGSIQPTKVELDSTVSSYTEETGPRPEGKSQTLADPSGECSRESAEALNSPQPS